MSFWVKGTGSVMDNSTEVNVLGSVLLLFFIWPPARAIWPNY